MFSQRRPVDTGANYNAFGWDPYGCIAYLCAIFFGPKYVPLVPSSQFGGPPEPPRYGPPAYYQIACLPPGFIPQSPPNYSQEIPCLLGTNGSEEKFLIPPAIFNPRIFDTFVGLERFLQFGRRSYIHGKTFASEPGCLGVEDMEEYDDGTEVGSELDTE